MFHWICPECGREIAPAVKECPLCDPASVIADSVAEGFVAAAPAQLTIVPEANCEAEALAEPRPQEAVAEIIPEPMAALEVAQVAAPMNELETTPSGHGLEAEPRLPETVAEKTPELVAVSEVAQVAAPINELETTPFGHDSEAERRPQEAVAEIIPEPMAASEVAQVAAPINELETALPGHDSEAEPRPQGAVAEIIPEPMAALEVSQVAAPINELETTPAGHGSEAEPILQAPDEFAEWLGALADQVGAGHIPYARPDGTDPKVAMPPVAPLPTPCPEIFPAAAKPMTLLAASAEIRLLPEPAPQCIASRAPMSADPQAVALRCTPKGLAGPEPLPGSIVKQAPRPPHIPAPGMADLADYPKVAAEATRPVAPKEKVMAVDTAPRVTLPGPTLPRELTSLQAAGLGTIMSGRPRRRSKGLPGWAVSFLVMALLLLTGFGVIFYAMPGILANTGPTPAKVEPVVAAAPAAYPLAKNVEVTGFRFLLDNVKKSEVHYLVVNHSSAVLNGMTIFVTLHSASASAGQPPLARFSFPAPNLGPFESREMSSPIEHVTKPFDLPGWQDVRAEVEIGQ